MIYLFINSIIMHFITFIIFMLMLTSNYLIDYLIIHFNSIMIMIIINLLFDLQILNLYHLLLYMANYF